MAHRSQGQRSWPSPSCLCGCTALTPATGAANVVLFFFFLSPLSTMGNVLRYRDSSSLVFPLSVMNIVNGTTWAVYGLVLTDPFIWVPNMVGAFLGALQVALCCIFPRRSGHRCAPGRAPRLLNCALVFAPDSDCAAVVPWGNALRPSWVCSTFATTFSCRSLGLRARAVRGCACNRAAVLLPLASCRQCCPVVPARLTSRGDACACAAGRPLKKSSRMARTRSRGRRPSRPSRPGVRRAVASTPAQ